MPWQVIKGFLPVDEYGNLVKNVQRAPEISIEGMPETKRRFLLLLLMLVVVLVVV